jgi:hypothetical protein
MSGSGIRLSEKIVGGALRGTWGIGKGLAGTHVGRAAAGATIGAVMGAGGSSDTTSFLGSLEGAMTGAGIGLGIGLIPKVGKGFLRAGHMKRSYRLGREAGLPVGTAMSYAGASLKSPLKTAAWESGKEAARGVAGAGKMALKTAGLIAKHPNAALALGGAGLGLSYLASSGAGTSNLTDRQRHQFAAQTGGTSYVSQVNKSFQGSTEGLVQGLHQARHR